MTYRRKPYTAPIEQYVEREFEQVEQEFALFNFVRFKELHEVPAKLFDGLTVFADGTDWNPGSGQGIYTYYNVAWHKLG